MQIDKAHGATLLRALEDAIRYRHMSNSPYDIRKYEQAHFQLVNKMWRSKELRQGFYLPRSILQGTDLGICSTVADVNSGKAPIVQKLVNEIEAIS